MPKRRRSLLIAWILIGLAASATIIVLYQAYQKTKHSPTIPTNPGYIKLSEAPLILD